MTWQRKPHAGRAAPNPVTVGEIELWIWAICLFLLLNPFAFILTGAAPSTSLVRDLSTMRAAADGSQAPIYVLRSIPFIVALMLAARGGRSLVASGGMVPVALFMLWACCSVIWSDTFTSSVNAVAALIMLVGTGYCAALRLSPQQLAKAVVYSGIILAVMSLLWVCMLPEYGVHQRTDAAQSVHDGAWRGVFAHKNHLGQTAALYAAATMLAGRNIVASRAVKWLLVGTFVSIILMTGSLSALVVLVMTPAVLWVTLCLGDRQRLAALLILPTIGAGMLLALDPVLAAFGRDVTLSGRAEVWAAGWRSLLEQPLVGFGYMSSQYGEFTRGLYQATGLTDPHNAYLDIALGLGLAGIVLLVFALMNALRVARQLYRVGGPDRQAAMVIGGVLVGWLISGLTESNARPFVSMAALGFIALSVGVYQRKVMVGGTLIEPRYRARSGRPGRDLVRPSRR